MKSFLLAAFIILGLWSCGGSGGSASGGTSTSLEGYETENLEHGVTRAFKKDAEGNYLEQGYLVNGVKNGLWTTYYTGAEVGKVKSTTSYVNGHLNGPFYEYTNRGQIETEVNYTNDEYNGLVASYKFGRPTLKQSYKNHKLNGTSYEYFGDGKVQKESNYKDGKQHGKMIWYNSEGKVTMEYEYENGEKMSGGIVKGDAGE